MLTYNESLCKLGFSLLLNRVHTINLTMSVKVWEGWLDKILLRQSWIVKRPFWSLKTFFATFVSKLACASPPNCLIAKKRPIWRKTQFRVSRRKKSILSIVRVLWLRITAHVSWKFPETGRGKKLLKYLEEKWQIFWADESFRLVLYGIYKIGKYTYLQNCYNIHCLFYDKN
jgi:hypothetical protein